MNLIHFEDLFECEYNDWRYSNVRYYGNCVLNRDFQGFEKGKFFWQIRQTWDRLYFFEKAADVEECLQLDLIQAVEI